MESSAELEKFLELDIIEFLDGKRAEEDEGIKINFYEDTRKALLANNSEAARKILEDAIEYYNGLSENDHYKQIIYNKILEIVHLNKNYIEQTKDSESMLAEDIQMLDESKQLGDKMPKTISALDIRKEEEQQKKFAEEEKEYELKENLNDKARKIMSTLFISIRKKDLPESIKKYKELKQCFEEYPAAFADEKKELYNDIIAVFMQIQKLKKELVQRKKIAPKQEEKEPEKPKEESDMNKIKKLIEEIKADVKKKDFHSAKAKIIELKHIASAIPEEKKHFRNLLNSKINTLNEKLDFIKRASSA